MTEGTMPKEDVQLCRRAIRALVDSESEFVVTLLDEWTAEAHAEGEVRAADTLLDLRSLLLPDRGAAASPIHGA